jgi:hypothetical protein
LTEAIGIFDLRERPHHHAAALVERIWNALVAEIDDAAAGGARVPLSL